MADLEARERKLAAKRNNERIKLLASWLNALSLGVAGAGLIVPMVTNPGALVSPLTAVWLSWSVFLHLLAQGALSLLRSED